MRFGDAEGKITEFAEAERGGDQYRVEQHRRWIVGGEVSRMLLHETGMQIAGAEGRMSEHTREIVGVGGDAEHRQIVQRGDRAVDGLFAVGAMHHQLSQHRVEISGDLLAYVERIFKADERRLRHAEIVDGAGLGQEVALGVLRKLEDHDVARLHELVSRHARYTNSAKAKAILADWDGWLPKFRKVMPVEYAKVLKEMAAAQAADTTGFGVLEIGVKTKKSGAKTKAAE